MSINNILLLLRPTHSNTMLLLLNFMLNILVVSDAKIGLPATIGILAG